MQEDNRIKCQPFSCNSPYLFEQFFLLGYSNDEKSKDSLRNIKNLPNSPKVSSSGEGAEKLSSNNVIPNKSLSYEKFDSSTYPTVLSSLGNNKINHAAIDASSVIHFIFPNKPKVYSLNNDDSHSSSETYFSQKKYNVIFFLNNDSGNSKEKNFTYGFAYVFYERYKSSQYGLLLIPKTFVFLSKYPFFRQMKSLANDLLKIFLTSPLPIEMILFNIINYSPGPCKVMSDFTLNCFPDTYYNNKLYGIDKMDMPLISGYPLIDLNISELLNFITVEIIIKAFIFCFLEIDMLVFSSNLEVLNIFLYFLYAINYPCNDAMYLWHIIAVSKEDLTSIEKRCKFVGKPFSNMLGIHCPYDDCICIDNFSREAVIVDIDNKELLYRTRDHDEHSIAITSLLNYLSSLCTSRENKSNNKLEQNIWLLYQRLDAIATKVINFNPSTSSHYIPKFFEMNESISQQTKQLQELFYSFVLNAIKPLYHSFRFDISFQEQYSHIIRKSTSNTNHPIVQEIHQIKWKKNEKWFYDLFMESTKYSQFIDNFIYNYDALENYQLPLLFTELFLNYDNSIESEYPFRHFDIIDSFYRKYSKKELQDIANPLSICNYSRLIKKSLKQHMLLHSNQMLKVKKSKTSTITKSKVKLDLDLLYQYISIVNNYDKEDIATLFPGSGVINRKKEIIVDFRQISQHFELCLVDYRTIKQRELVSYCIILFLALTCDYMDSGDFLNNLEVVFELIHKQKHFVRQYLTTLLDVYYHKAIKLREIGIDYSHYILGYRFIIEYLYSHNIYPSSHLSHIIAQFNAIGTPDEKKPIKTNFSIFQIEEINSPLEKKEKGRISSISLQATQYESGFDKSIEGDSSDLLNTTCPNSFEIKTVNYTLFLSRNMCREGKKKTSEIISAIDYGFHEEDLSFQCNTCDKTVSPMLKFQIKTPQKYQSEINIYSPLKLYSLCWSLMTAWVNNDMRRESIDVNNLRNVMINLLFYEQTVLTKNKLILLKELFCEKKN